MVEMGRGRKGSMQSTGVCAEVGRAGDAQDRGGEGEGSDVFALRSDTGSLTAILDRVSVSVPTSIRLL